MALNHELGAFKRIRLKVVDKNRPVRVFFRHLGSVLPCEKILGAFGRAHQYVERTKLEAVEFTGDEGGSLLLVFGLAGEASKNTSGWLGEVAIAIHFN
jgi:hypothetical protein